MDTEEVLEHAKQVSAAIDSQMAALGITYEDLGLTQDPPPRVKNMACNEIKAIHLPKENIMTELAQTPEAPTEPVVEKSNRFKNFVNTHPRTAKVVGFTAGAAVVVGVVAAAKNLKDKTNVDSSVNLEITYDSTPDATTGTEA